MTNPFQNFYRYQQRRLGILLGWGLVNMLIGASLQGTSSSFWKQFGLQACTWGAIDTVLAIFGIRSARRKEQDFQQAKIEKRSEQKEINWLHRILVINVGLDVLYILSGAWVLGRFTEQQDRQGLGWGVLIQGLWLFLFDGFLVGEIRRHWLQRP
ncbi:hypothetical protein KDA_02110 [Dictyobacter alpinus]|uniref:Uncharacterized protein n=1 Tax=Dictyobacter alpinus TaxID=2014873 RepID=A0A402B086_9CHLR|nr:hypothetical protein [Dictyobacter alpinus]GCE24727.1 hypothetical protein KDA_02110 [Dictyobacter alpinus]